ncbi:MAG: DUF4445 domain-containing protein [Actinobacteria bacterium]|nr:DUF4445 domain-containing protein [Actinomycetota bacterium]
MTERATIRFEPTGRTVTVPVGSTLLEAVRAAGLPIDAPCGGTGTCGSCRVHAEGAVDAATHGELELLGGAGVAAGKRLACRARVSGDAVVTLDEPSREARVVTSASQAPLEVEPPASRGIEALGPLAGVAVDVGTTTVAVQLLDLRTGQVLASEGDLNAQRTLGADVLSRVAYASAGGSAELQGLISGQVETMIGEALGASALSEESLVEGIVVGNTAMTGLLLGADVSALGEAPYADAPTGAVRVAAYEIGMDSLPSLDLDILPGASAFVGSDITAGLVATRLAERVAPTLLLDLGTNGEIVVAAHGEFIAASTAAGPALEGASIECGMRAETGAIERVSFDGGRLELGVIGDGEPKGICGSGLLDLVAVLLDEGVLDATGAFADTSGSLGTRLAERDGVRVFEVLGEVVLTQKDVRQVQLAVGAVRTGIDLMLADVDLRPEAVVSVVVAGGFGFHVRADSLVRVGLIPAMWRDRVDFAGNTALAGARMALVNSATRDRAHEIVSRMRTIDLAAHPDFQQRFLAALAFPA